MAARLTDLRTKNPVVIGLPNGGVPVAAEVAAALQAPLDVIVVRKLGVPFQPELAMGAIAEGGARVLDHELIAQLGITPARIQTAEQAERRTLDARSELLHARSGRVQLSGRTVLIVDDGIATGATATAACSDARANGAAHVVVAAPVGGLDAVDRVQGADEVICLIQPRDFRAVGEHYRSFGQTSEPEVLALLAEARERMAAEHG